MDGICIASLEIGDDHHVLPVAIGDGKCLRERLQQEIFEVERGADHDVTMVELAGNQTSPVPPLEQTIAATLDNTAELIGHAAEVGKVHRFNETSRCRDRRRVASRGWDGLYFLSPYRSYSYACMVAQISYVSTADDRPALADDPTHRTGRHEVATESLIPGGWTNLLTPVATLMN
jgi:hypothetical protein